ncbi:M-phase inducer phosphatase 1-B [Trichinella nativa]|uniref:protein-tyrosine-phosphatase n=1 Tax=Trichinella nativa TaxID=6335 RepID=A0A0V1L6U9_9BILA|nr:M-phase inducer phosphatase 1-B [Trichinella nativa]
MENQIVKSVHLEDQIRDKNRATKKNGEMSLLQDVTNCPINKEEKNRATKKNGEMTVLQDVTNRLINKEEKALISRRNLAENASQGERKLINNSLSSSNTDLSNSQTLTRTRCSEKWSQFPLIPPVSDFKSVADLDFDEYWNFVEKNTLLPYFKSSKVPDVQSVTADDLVNLINKRAELIMQFDIIDCRYPFEYDGGHIRGAVNIFEKQQLVNYLFVDEDLPSVVNKKKVLVFYCEFSQQRGPTMYRFLRNFDRTINRECYPNLYYPEIYLLDKGYNCFYKQYKDYCEPPNYVPMIAESHRHELITYRQKRELHF